MCKSLLDLECNGTCLPLPAEIDSCNTSKGVCCCICSSFRLSVGQGLAIKSLASCVCLNLCTEVQ